MIPYLKGIHHTLESWRFGRNEDGWKYGTVEMMKWLNEEMDLEGESLEKETITKSTWKDVFKNLKIGMKEMLLQDYLVVRVVHNVESQAFKSS